LDFFFLMSTLLDRYFLGPIQQLGSGALHEMGHVVSPVVHAMEAPVLNVWRDSQEVVGGLYRATTGVMHILPYVVGGWLAWTAFEMYFPGEYQSVYRTVNNAAKRLRIR
jgi:hypothetical protein